MMLPNVSLLAEHHRLRVLAVIVLGMIAACTILAFLAFRGGVSRSWGGAKGTGCEGCRKANVSSDRWNRAASLAAAAVSDEDVECLHGTEPRFACCRCWRFAGDCTLTCLRWHCL
jgi:hypothetical protein